MGVSIVSFTRAWIPGSAPFIEVVSGETPVRHNSSLDMGSYTHQSSAEYLLVGRSPPVKSSVKECLQCDERLRFFCEIRKVIKLNLLAQ